MLCISHFYCCYLHMYMSSAYYLRHMHIMHTLSAVVLDIFLPNRQCHCHPYVISSTLYISYHVQLSFCTLSAQTHIVYVIRMLCAYVHIICLSFLTLLVYPIIHNLVSTHCLHTCTLSMSSVYCIQMHMLCTFDIYCCYLHMYMSSTHYLTLVSSACHPHVIRMSSAHCLHITHTSYAHRPHIVCTSSAQDFSSQTISSRRAETALLKMKECNKSGRKLCPYHHIWLDKEFVSDCMMWQWFLENLFVQGMWRPFVDFMKEISAKTLLFYSDT